MAIPRWPRIATDRPLEEAEQPQPSLRERENSKKDEESLASSCKKKWGGGGGEACKLE